MAHDAARQLYKVIFEQLTEDPDLVSLLGHTLEDPRIHQTYADYDTSGNVLTNRNWITFNIVSDRPMDADQTQDIREIVLDVHTWRRGTGDGPADEVEEHIRRLLDNQVQDLNSDYLLLLKILASGYFKTFEVQSQLWHIITTFDILCVAQRPD